MQTSEVKSPYTQEVVAKYEFDGFEGVQKKLLRLQTAQRAWKKVPLKTRIDAVKNALNYFTANKDQIARDISVQMGRPISQSPGEIKGLLERANYLCSIAEEALSAQSLPAKEEFERSIVREPLGVIGHLSRFRLQILEHGAAQRPHVRVGGSAGDEEIIRHVRDALEAQEHDVVRLAIEQDRRGPLCEFGG